MARLKNRNHGIPPGFTYLQAQTGKQFKGHSFSDLVQQVIKHRTANPQHKYATDYGSVAEEVETYLVKILSANPRWLRFLSTGTPQAPASKPWSPQQLLQKAGSAVGVAKTHIKNTVAGIGLYVDWFGHGGTPETKEEATRRAAICVRCPKLIKGDFVQRWNRATSFEIMTVLSILKDLDLSTEYDKQFDEKGVCDACDCPMKAKIWSPLPIIKKHMVKESALKLWPQCWITDHAGRRSRIEE